MIRYFKSPLTFRKWYPNFEWTLPKDDTVYLTFDDGPDPEVTPWVLEQLNEHDALATFFCLGKSVEQNPNTAKMVLESGHQLGNHTYSHSKGWKTDLDDYLKDVLKCDETLGKIGVQSEIFRPPYGKIRRKQARNIKKRVVMWSHSSYDFDGQLNISQSIRNLKRAKPGSIILFHDTQKAFKNLKQILPLMLEYYHSKGFKLDAIK